MGSIRGEGGAGGGGGGLADLVDDTTPQLGGNLDVNGHNVGGVTPTELGYLSGVTSAIQTQLGAKAPTNSPALTGTPTAPTAAADTNTTQIATTAFVLGQISAAVSGLLDLKGSTDCSATPNYPAASKGDSYIVSVAGKIGGASGKSVDVGDMYIASADNAGGTEASVGTSWFVVEHNLAGAILSANNLSDIASAATARTNLGLGTADSVTFGVVVGGNTSTFADVYFYNGTLASARGVISLMYNPSGAGTGYAIRLADKAQELMLGSAVSEATFAAQRVHDFKGTTDATASLNQWLKGSTVVAEMTANGQLQLNISTGTAPLTVASTTVVTNLNADKLDGKDATDFAPCTQATLTAAASVALDFAAAGLATLTTDQDTTFTTSNRAAGRQPYNLRIIGGGAHTLTFPAGWKWLNSTMPAAIASGKTGRLCLECYGSADTDVVASFAVEA